jgi:hypothetical protein
MQYVWSFITFVLLVFSFSVVYQWIRLTSFLILIVFWAIITRTHCKILLLPISNHGLLLTVFKCQFYVSRTAKNSKRKQTVKRHFKPYLIPKLNKNELDNLDIQTKAQYKPSQQTYVSWITFKVCKITIYSGI